MGSNHSLHDIGDNTSQFSTQVDLQQTFKPNQIDTSSLRTYFFHIIGLPASGKTSLYHQLKRIYTPFNNFTDQERKHATQRLFIFLALNVTKLGNKMVDEGYTFASDESADSLRGLNLLFFRSGNYHIPSLNPNFVKEHASNVYLYLKNVCQDSSFLDFWEKHRQDQDLPTNMN